MDKMIIPIINGPNLNLTGIREPKLYGHVTFEEFIFNLRETNENIIIPYHQSNHEGDIIDFLHYYGFSTKGIVLNPGAYTHTSIAIADAIRSIESPVVEVHLTDIKNREPFRQVSYIEEPCIHSISGKGIEGYLEAIKYIEAHR